MGDNQLSDDALIAKALLLDEPYFHHLHRTCRPLVGPMDGHEFNVRIAHVTIRVYEFSHGLTDE